MHYDIPVKLGFHDQIKKTISWIRRTHSDRPFFLILLFLLFDYARPQSMIPGLSLLKIGMIVQVLLLFTLFSRRKLLTLGNVQTKYFVALIFLMGVHVLIASNNYWAFQIWKVTVLYFIVYLSIVSFVDSYSKVEKVIQTWVVVNLFCALNGLLHRGKIPGSTFLGDENDFALVMDIMIPLAFFMALKSDSKRKKLFYMGAIFIFVLACIISFSRGGFLGLVVAALYCLLKTRRKMLAVLFIGMLVGIMYLSAPQGYGSRLRSISEQNFSAGTGESRWYSWKLALRMFRDHPFIGVGQGNYIFKTEDYQTIEELTGRNAYRRNMWGRAAHSLHFTVVAELGIIGVFLFYGMAYSSYRELKRFRKKDAINPHTKTDATQYRFLNHAVTGALITFLVTASFISVFDYPHFWILTGLCTALINARNARGTAQRQRLPATVSGLQKAPR